MLIWVDGFSARIEPGPAGNPNLFSPALFSTELRWQMYEHIELPALLNQFFEVIKATSINLSPKILQDWESDPYVISTCMWTFLDPIVPTVSRRSWTDRTRRTVSKNCRRTVSRRSVLTNRYKVPRSISKLFLVLRVYQTSRSIWSPGGPNLICIMLLGLPCFLYHWFGYWRQRTSARNILNVEFYLSCERCTFRDI